MLDDAIAGFLDSVTEREFDAPFIALLRAHGFTKIHLLHGQYEFGKDAIAQTDDPPTQYVFQTKAGDINLPQWSGSVRGQVEMMRTNTLAHPDFDASAPRVAVLVLTGRLTGGAPLEVQNYADQLPDGEPAVVVWDKERLIELFGNSPEAGLTGFADGPLLELMGRVDLHKVTESHVERFSERWIGGSEGVEWRSVLEAAMVANRLRRSERLDLAAFTPLCLLRAVWATAHGAEPIPELAATQADIAASMFRQAGGEIWKLRSDELLIPEKLVRDDIGGLVTYPVQCARLIELLGLYGLDQTEDREEVASWLSAFLVEQPGAAHPISDRWAVSLIPALLLVASRDRTVSRNFLIEVLRWLGDHYENDEAGLAGPDAEPDQEVAYFLGGGLEHVDAKPRQHSYLGAVVLDLAALLEDEELYDLAYNELAAVGAIPLVALPRDDVSQYMKTGHGVDVPVNTSPKYTETLAEGDAWRTSAHHDEDLSRYYLGRGDRLWDHLTLSLVTRDRHWVAGLRRLLSDNAAA